MSDEAPQVPNFNLDMLATLSPETKATFASQMEKAGYSRTDVEAKLNAAVAPKPETVFKPAISQEAAIAGSIDRTFAPPAAPNEYQIDIPSYLSSEPTEKIAKSMGELKSGFHSAGVPASMANPMAQSFFEAAQKWPGNAGEEAQQAYLREQAKRISALTAVFPDDLKRFADIGQKALGAAGEELYRAGSFFTPEALVALAQFGRIVAGRTKK